MLDREGSVDRVDPTGETEYECQFARFEKDAQTRSALRTCHRFMPTWPRLHGDIPRNLLFGRAKALISHERIHEILTASSIEVPCWKASIALFLNGGALNYVQLKLYWRWELSGAKLWRTKEANIGRLFYFVSQAPLRTTQHSAIEEVFFDGL